MKIDVAGARARAGSRYPKPFDEPCQNKTRRRLGLAAGLTQFGVNLLELRPGAWSAIGTLATTSSSMSSGTRSCSLPMLAKPCSTPAIEPVSRPVSAWAVARAAGGTVVEATDNHILMGGSEPHDSCCMPLIW